LEDVPRRTGSGAPWREIPAKFVNWISVFKRFEHWEKQGGFDRIFEKLDKSFDFERVCVDGDIVQARSKAFGK